MNSGSLFSLDCLLPTANCLLCSGPAFLFASFSLAVKDKEDGMWRSLDIRIAQSVEIPGGLSHDPQPNRRRTSIHNSKRRCCRAERMKFPLTLSVFPHSFHTPVGAIRNFHCTPKADHDENITHPLFSVHPGSVSDGLLSQITRSEKPDGRRRAG